MRRDSASTSGPSLWRRGWAGRPLGPSDFQEFAPGGGSAQNPDLGFGNAEVDRQESDHGPVGPAPLGWLPDPGFKLTLAGLLDPLLPRPGMHLDGDSHTQYAFFRCRNVVIRTSFSTTS